MAESKIHRPPPTIILDRALSEAETPKPSAPPPRSPWIFFAAAVLVIVLAAGAWWWLARWRAAPPSGAEGAAIAPQIASNLSPASTASAPTVARLPFNLAASSTGQFAQTRFGALMFRIDCPPYASNHLALSAKQVWIRPLSGRALIVSNFDGWVGVTNFPLLLENLPAGGAEVALRADGYEIEASPRRVLVSAAATTEVVFTAAPLRARVTVSCNVTNALVCVQPAGATNEFKTAKNAKQEIFAIVPALQPLVLTVSAPGYLSQAFEIGGILPGSNLVKTVALAPLPPPAPQKRMGPKYKAGRLLKLDVGSGVALEMVWIPEGEFVMGSPPDELGRYADEGPQHLVVITEGFWLGRYEVTQAQWVSLMQTNSARFKGGDLPVETVSWQDCRRFLEKLNAKKMTFEKQLLVFDLPSEAEWEYACRAGRATACNNGRNLTTLTGKCPALDEIGWFSGNSEKTTHPVGRKRPNNWGLYDMHGNVWEFCRDGKRVYAPLTVTDPLGGGDLRVVRGGSWGDYARFCRAAARYALVVKDKGPYFGLRIMARMQPAVPVSAGSAPAP